MSLQPPNFLNFSHFSTYKYLMTRTFFLRQFLWVSENFLQLHRSCSSGALIKKKKIQDKTIVEKKCCINYSQWTKREN